MTHQLEGATANDPLAVMQRLQPCVRSRGRPSDPLWVIHDLDIRDKHKALHLLGGAVFEARHLVKNVHGTYTVLVGGQWQVRLAEDGAEVLSFEITDNSQSPMHMDPESPLQVVLDEVRPGQYEPVVPLMASLVDVTKRTLQDFRGCFR